jgi:hypothetical protein
MEVNTMQTKTFCYAIFVTIFLYSASFYTHARNCNKGKPCGNGCIAKQKTCRIENSADRDSASGAKQRSVIRRVFLRLPQVYQITTERTYAREAPDSPVTTGYYKQGQRVFVYTIADGWARISNMQPEEWIEISKLTPVQTGTR